MLHVSCCTFVLLLLMFAHVHWWLSVFGLLAETPFPCVDFLNASFLCFGLFLFGLEAGGGRRGDRFARSLSAWLRSEERQLVDLGSCKPGPKNLFGLFLTFRVLSPYFARLFLEIPIGTSIKLTSLGLF